MTHDDLLVKLGDTGMTVSDPAEDIRGRKVLDRHGDDIGHVEHLYIDNDDRRVRFMEVGAGGFLGLGEKRFMIPIDAITRITDDSVQVDQTREHVTGGPDYDPSIAAPRGRDFWEPYYGYYGYAPFWGAGYVYPRYPFY